MLDKNIFLKTEWTDPVTCAKGYLVISNLINNFSVGGIRMRSGLDVKEVEDLARIMTPKFLAMGIPFGGAKGGINYDPDWEDSRGVLKRYLKAHLPFILENWVVSEDMGTKENEIIDILKELGVETSIKAFLKTVKDNEKVFLQKNYAEGVHMKYDNMVFTDVITGYGVAVATKGALSKLGIDPRKAKVSIQGFGSVGGGGALYLSRQGIKIVAIADEMGTIYSEEGFNIPNLLKIRNDRGIIDRAKLPNSCLLQSKEYWLSLDVDVLVPAAIADAINIDNVESVQAKLIIEGANMPISQEAQSILEKKGINIIPDFIASSGGIGLFGALLYRRLTANPENILQYLDETISSSVEWIFKISEDNKISMREAAYKLVLKKQKELPGACPRK